MISPRPAVFDLSFLSARLRAAAFTGVDRIDLAFAAHFLAGSARAEAVRYGRSGLRRLAPKSADALVQAAREAETATPSGRFEALCKWLGSGAEAWARPGAAVTAKRRLLSWASRLAGPAFTPAAGAVYLNIGFHRFDEPRLFGWLAARPDVDAVFMIHDLLPLDWPEYFPAGEAHKFDARLMTALRLGTAFLVSTETVRRRLETEIAARGLAARPIWARPFPSPLAAHGSAPAVASARPYFVVVGTIEPRKNHLLLLQAWRALAARMAAPPRLVVVGARGWDNEQAVDLLDRCAPLKPLVAETSGLAAHDLAALMKGARAVLAPSFDEGYGLPVVEALALGAPVVAADTPAFREVSQGRARLLSPLDGEAWAREIARLAADDAYRDALRARDFVAPDWPGYFASLERFLADLPRGPPAKPHTRQI